MEENLELPWRAFRVSHCETRAQLCTAQGNGVGKLELVWPGLLSTAVERAMREPKVKLHGAITTVAR
jgi:hypothetical protein